MATPWLTDQQLAFYNTFGFLKFPGLLSDRLGPISAEFEALFAREAGRPAGRTTARHARSSSPSSTRANI